MNRFIRVGDMAIKLALRDALRRETERPRVGVARLPFELREVDGPSIEPARRAGLEAAELETTRSQAVAERLRRTIARPAA